MCNLTRYSHLKGPQEGYDERMLYAYIGLLCNSYKIKYTLYAAK